MDNGITFKSIFVPEMIDTSIQRISIYTKIPDTESFQYETENIQILQQIIWPNPKRSDRKGRIDEISGIRSPDRRLRA